MSLRPVHHEPRVVVALVGRRERGHRLRDVGLRDRVIDVAGHHPVDRDRSADLDQGWLVEAAVVLDELVGHVGGEHHPAPGRVRVAGEQSQ